MMDEYWGESVSVEKQWERLLLLDPVEVIGRMKSYVGRVAGSPSTTEIILWDDGTVKITVYHNVDQNISDMLVYRERFKGDKKFCHQKWDKAKRKDKWYDCVMLSYEELLTYDGIVSERWHSVKTKTDYENWIHQISIEEKENVQR
jgi:hypothetical protein